MYISFGGGMRLVGEDYILRELAPLGLTKKGLRGLFRNLSIPLIHGPRDQVLVDLISFMIAMRTITRPGAPDFSLPGSKQRPKTRNKLPPQEMVDHIEQSVTLIEQGRKMFGIVKPGALRSAAGEVVSRLKDTQTRINNASP